MTCSSEGLFRGVLPTSCCLTCNVSTSVNITFAPPDGDCIILPFNEKTFRLNYTWDLLIWKKSKQKILLLLDSLQLRRLRPVVDGSTHTWMTFWHRSAQFDWPTFCVPFWAALQCLLEILENFIKYSKLLNLKKRKKCTYFSHITRLMVEPHLGRLGPPTMGCCPSISHRHAIPQIRLLLLLYVFQVLLMNGCISGWCLKLCQTATIRIDCPTVGRSDSRWDSARWCLWRQGRGLLNIDGCSAEANHSTYRCCGRCLCCYSWWPKSEILF